MSLIVARQFGQDLMIFGDTYFTDVHGIGPPDLRGIIKTVVLTDSLCISFAGNVHWATDALRELSLLGLQGPDDVASVLLRVHNDSKCSTDFLVASATPDSRLIEIKSGYMKPVVASWLGSGPAFERFQGFATGALSVAPPPTGAASFGLVRIPDCESEESGRVYSSLFNAMCAVIDDGSIPEVGGFTVPVGFHHGKFEYMDYAAVLTNPIQWDLMPKTCAIPFGTAEQGGYAFNLMSAQPSSTAGLAVYVSQGRYGVAFTPHEGLLVPNPFSDVSPLEFEESAASALGLRVGCMYTIPEEHCERAMNYLNSGNLDAALSEAEKGVARGSKLPVVYRTRGIVKASTGDLEAAIADFSAAIQLDPDHAPTFDNRGIVRLRCGRIVDAICDFSEAIRSSPTYERGYEHRALAARKMGDVCQAEVDEAELRRLRGTE